MALGSLLLSHLYYYLTNVLTQIIDFDPENPKKKSVLAYGSFWLLQQWLNATFSQDIAPFRSNAFSFPPTQQKIVSQHLLPLTLADRTSPSVEVFKLLFTVMLTREKFEPFMAPFHDQKQFSDWFSKILPPTNFDDSPNLAF